MNKNLRRRKIKVLMKISTPLGILQQPVAPESNINLAERRVWENESSSMEDIGNGVLPICEWNDSIILDLFGIVPIAGDALDLGRSFVYLNCGKYLDAAIGIICVIPVYGSALGIYLKALRKSGKITDLKRMVFEAIDWAAKNLKIDEEVAYQRIVQSLNVISSEPRAFYEGLKKGNVEFIESMISIEDNLNKFDSYINKVRNIDIEAYRKWKKSSIESSNFSPDKLNKVKRRSLNSSKSMYSIAKSATKLPMSIMMKGFDAILKRIYNGLYESFLEIIKKERIIVEEYIDKINFKEEIFDYAEEIDLPDEIIESMHRELNSHNLNTPESIGTMREILKKYENKKYDIHNISNQQKLLGVSEKISRSVSRNFDIFFIHCTSESYMKMIHRNINLYRKTPISYEQVSKMINSFFIESPSTKANIDIIKEMGDGWAGAAWDEYIEVVEGSLEGSSILSHELLHHFDRNFVIHMENKYNLKFPFYHVSEMAIAVGSKNPLRASMIDLYGGNFSKFDKIFSNNLKINGIPFDGGVSGAGDTFTSFDRLKYIIKPTEVLSYFNDVRSLMIDQAELAGKSISYPSTEDVIDFALVRATNPFFKTLLNSLFDLEVKYGSKAAYDVVGADNKTGDFLLDFFSQYGV